MTTIQDPFRRGPYPVGVGSREWSDVGRARALPIEIYFPAAEVHAGQDLDARFQDRFSTPGSMTGAEPRRQRAVRDAEPRAGAYPVVIFSHGYSGDRREFSHLCSHLASHGYRVISADHVGSTFADVAAQMSDPNFDRRKSLGQMCDDRQGDIPFLLNMAEKEFGTRIEAAGCTGVSFGGWTSICAPAVDARIKAIAPQCPGGADGPLGIGESNVLGSRMRFDWKTSAEMMMFVGDRDSWLPLYGQLAVFEKCISTSKKLAILKRADHQHFVDDMEICHEWFRSFTLELAAHDRSKSGPPWAAIADMIPHFETLMPEAEAQKILFGFITLHMDTHLKGLHDAADVSISALRTTANEQNLGLYVFGA